MKSEFFDSLVENEQLAPRLYRTTEDWECHWTWSDGSTRRLFIPKGYVYDGMSVPCAGWSIARLHPDSYREAHLPHDALYRAKGGSKPEGWKGCRLTNHNGNKVTVGRTEADFLIAAIMDEQGASKWQLWFVRTMCRRLGWIRWGGPMPSHKHKE